MKLTAPLRGIVKIADHVLRNNEKVKKGVEVAMGGQVLELESERIARVTREEDIKQMKQIIRLLKAGEKDPAAYKANNIPDDVIEELLKDL